MKDKKIHFIVNPISGKGIGIKVKNRIEEIFLNYDKEIKVTRKKDDGYKYALQSIEDGADIIVSCGGDGTLNEVATALVNKQSSLAIVPIGSGNGLARHLNISLAFEEALQLIKSSKKIIKVIDCGRINNMYFFSNAGIGFDADIVNIYSHQKERQLLGYIKSLILSVFKFKPIQIDLHSQEKNYTGKAMMLNISNSNCLGYGFSISPNASLQDGKFDINLITKCSWGVFGLLGMGYLLKTNFESKKRIFFKSNQLEVDFDDDFIQIDGEYMPVSAKKLKISLLPQSLKVLIG
jgi:diacylglycerol kinase (ATP)